MGRKVHPTVFRLQTIFSSNSKWFTTKQFANYLRQDTQIREFLQRKLRGAGLARVDIERSSNLVTVTIHTSKTGVVIGRGVKGIDELRKSIQQEILPVGLQLKVSVQEVARPELNARLVAQSITEQLEKRIAFRRAIKRAVEQVMTAGAQGVKIMAAGRLNGAEIGRTETFLDGKLPLHTLRANIDFARETARTTYGAVGVKVWIYKGEVFETDDVSAEIGTTVTKRKGR